jgi:hypothetical protein
MVKRRVVHVFKSVEVKFEHNMYQLTSEVKVSRSTVLDETRRDSIPDKLSGKTKVPQTPLKRVIGAR